MMDRAKKIEEGAELRKRVERLLGTVVINGQLLQTNATPRFSFYGKGKNGIRFYLTGTISNTRAELKNDRLAVKLFFEAQESMSATVTNIFSVIGEDDLVTLSTYEGQLAGILSFLEDQRS